jgi:hypothetical protein
MEPYRFSVTEAALKDRSVVVGAVGPRWHAPAGSAAEMRIRGYFTAAPRSSLSWRYFTTFLARSALACAVNVRSTACGWARGSGLLRVGGGAPPPKRCGGRSRRRG